MNRKKIQQLRKVIFFYKWWNSQKYLPGIFRPERKIIINEYIEKQAMSIWNAFTNIPINNHKEIVYQIKMRLDEIAEKYYRKGKEDILKQIKK